MVEIKGLDIYDPTTGQIRSSSTDDIACWFIDTNYNGESFFVRHAYFTGADEPYDKLKRALRADIDEAAWSALYSTTSRPFPKPATGKIAIKVINHYGDEVLKVFGLERPTFRFRRPTLYPTELIARIYLCYVTTEKSPVKENAGGRSSLTGPGGEINLLPTFSYHSTPASGRLPWPP